jgi:hypothetical protein
MISSFNEELQMRPSQRPRAPAGVRPSRPSSYAETSRRPRVRAIGPPAAHPINRRAALSRVLALWPQEIDDLSVEGRCNILSRLKRALRAERRRGIAGHWAYDLARHVELLHVYRQELASLREMGATQPRFSVRAT